MIVFLHGFLGTKEDWDEVISHLPFACLAIDIEKITEYKNCHLVGYSMGGRIALQLKNQYPNRFGKVVAISAHPGLHSEKEKKARWESDQKWVEMLKNSSLEEFVKEWYAQPLFKTLDLTKIWSRRLKQDKKRLIHLLETYSLAKQEFALPSDTLFLCGEKDSKYVELYNKLVKNHVILPDSGHALHLENPKLLAQEITKWLT